MRMLFDAIVLSRCHGISPRDCDEIGERLRREWQVDIHGLLDNQFGMTSEAV